MNDISDLVPLLAAHLNMNPATVGFYLSVALFLAHRVALILSRRIPDDATGWQATVRTIASWFALDPSAVITSTPAGPVSVQDAVRASLAPPTDAPVADKVAADKGVPVTDVQPKGA